LVEDFHALKGVLANIGLQPLATIAGELQKISEEGDFLSVIEKQDKLLKQLKELLNLTPKEISNASI
jgi:HPt (histidine-containing phosphotransfer) domain-containing protein